MKKPGFKVKFNSEKTLYAVIIIIIFLFIFNMKSIYDFAIKLKNGSLFQNNSVQTPVSSDPTVEDPSSDNDEYTIVKPVGKESCKCTKKVTDATGTKNTTVNLYFTDEKIKSLEEDNTYDAISDEYTNYIYSEKKKYESFKNDNISLDGFSVVVSLEGNTYMATSTVVDLSKVALTDIKTNDEDLLLFGKYNDNISSVISLFSLEGFTCDQ